MSREVIATAGAPEAIGPYSQAIRAGELLFCSGQVGLDPVTGELVEGGVAAQAERALLNLGAVLDAAGGNFNDVVKTTVFLTDIADFVEMNEIYARYFGIKPPARSTVAVRALPKGAVFEIEAIARLS
ncbi:MAG TPA: RidA family protein [Actinomycetota bacterium]|nr:RidA family protein [Actinomycetota bacterium]